MFSSLRNYSKYIVVLIAVAMVATGALYGYGSYLNRQSPAANTPSNIIASVNDTNISQQQFYAILQDQAAQASQLGRSQIVPFKLNILDSLIERELIMQKAKEMGLETRTTDKDVDEYIEKILEANDLTEEELKENLSKQGTSLDMVKKDIKAALGQNDLIQQTRESTHTNIKVSEDEIVDSYESADMQVIMVQFAENKEEARDKIKEAEALINKGRAFSEIASEYSDLKYNKGNIGVITRNNNFVPVEIVEKALGMEKGKTSEIIEGENAYYLIQLKDKKLASGEEYEKAKEEIEKEILTSKQNKAFYNWLENAKAEADIQINDPVLRGYKALQNDNYDVAINDFEKLMENEPAPSIYTYLAQAYKGAGKEDKGKEIYEKAINVYPKDWELHLNYGNYLASLEEPAKEEAIAQYDKAAELSGEDFMAHYKLYLAYSSVGANDKAKVEMERVKEIQEKMMEEQKKMKEQLKKQQQEEAQNEEDKESETTDQDN